MEIQVLLVFLCALLGIHGFPNSNEKDKSLLKQGLFAGEKGPKGYPGFRGERGYYGSDGPKGYKGYPGELGLPGQKGDTGMRGFPGPQGPKGEEGVNGKGYFGLKGDKGESCEIFLKGYPGLKGMPGEKGDEGESGKKGNKGELGNPGIIGLNGVPGRKGARGRKGAQGAPGGCDNSVREEENFIIVPDWLASVGGSDEFETLSCNIPDSIKNLGISLPFLCQKRPVTVNTEVTEADIESYRVVVSEAEHQIIEKEIRTTTGNEKFEESTTVIEEDSEFVTEPAPSELCEGVLFPIVRDLLLCQEKPVTVNTDVIDAETDSYNVIVSTTENEITKIETTTENERESTVIDHNTDHLSKHCGDNRSDGPFDIVCQTPSPVEVYTHTSEVDLETYTVTATPTEYLTENVTEFETTTENEIEDVSVM